MNYQENVCYESLLPTWIPLSRIWPMGSAFNFIGATLDSSSLLCMDIYAEAAAEQSGSNYVEEEYYVG